MLIIGIDPGTERTGYGVLKLANTNPSPRKTHTDFACLEYGVLYTQKSQGAGERLLELNRLFEDLLAKHPPSALGIERLFFFKNQKTVMAVSEARGILLAAAAKNNIPVYEFTPLQIKMGVVGYGRAEKKQVQYMVKELLSLEEIPKPDDAADALGIALACGLSLRSPYNT